MAVFVYLGFTRGDLSLLWIDKVCGVILAILFWLHQGEYHIVCVDFIFSSRGRLERDRGFANPLSLSNTSPDPWGDPLRRGNVGCRGLCQYRIPISGAVVTRQFRIWFGWLCSGYGRSRFSRVAQLVSHVFHYWWEGLFVPAATGGFAFSFVGFARNLLRRLTREWGDCFCW